MSYARTISVISLLLLFVFSAVGVTINRHFCPVTGEKVMIVVGEDADDCSTKSCCDDPEKERRKSCCEDENKYLVNDTPKQKEEVTTEKKLPKSIITILLPYLENLRRSVIHTDDEKPNSGPKLNIDGGSAFGILFQVFRL